MRKTTHAVPSQMNAQAVAGAIDITPTAVTPAPAPPMLSIVRTAGFERAANPVELHAGAEFRRIKAELRTNFER